MGSEKIYLESDYEYVLGSVMGNILNLQASFSSMQWVKSDLELIAKELVNTGKLFATQQGLGSVDVINDVSIYGNPVQIHRKKRHRTGTLINHIQAHVDGTTINFFNNANLGRGFYAGHIEYGFHDRGGHPVAARPFMRPAFQAVARASMGQIRGTLKAFLEQGLMLRNYAMFGTPTTSSGGLRAFYNQPRGPVRGLGAGTYTTQGLRNPMFNRQAYWTKGTEKSNGIGVNRSNRLLGTVRDNQQASFIGRGNGVSGGKRSPSLLDGNQRTRSTWYYGRSKWGNKHSTIPREYIGYGKMNTKIPGRGSKIKYNPKETQSRLQARKEARQAQTQKTSASKNFGRSYYGSIQNFAKEKGLSLRNPQERAQARDLWKKLGD